MKPQGQVCFPGFVFTGLLLLLAGCAASSGQGGSEAVERTWLQGQHQLPASALREGQYTMLDEIRDHPLDWGNVVAMQKLKAGVRLPAVIYLHGCAGNRNGDSWSAEVNRLGFAFFAPDSLARPRQSMCGTGRMTSIRIPLRTRELRYALAQLQQLSWIDQQRIVLIGFSEGAQTAAAYRGEGFAAVVLMGTNCKFSGGSPQTQAGVAVLSLKGANDTQYDGVGCRIVHDDGLSRSVLVDAAGHNLRNNQKALVELEAFLRRVVEP